MIKKFKIFEIKNLDIDPFGEEDWSDNEIYIDKLRQISLTVTDGGTGCYTIYLNEPVVIGKKYDKDIICNYYYSQDNDVIFHVLYDEQTSDVYDKEYRFTYKDYYGLNKTFDLYENFVEKIYNETIKIGSHILTNDVIERKEFNSKIFAASKNGWRQVDFESRIKYEENKIFLHYIANRNKCELEYKNLHDMKTQGEKVFYENQDRKKAIFDEIMRENMPDWLF